ncbi:GUN4 domain-containing protein [Pseudanabaenaceae cyanobacterium LEGE 13415]|nr:GUN4 domain-containing protein [Pseudanabaenaceae cyanobacterium LEGE 13415]
MEHEQAEKQPEVFLELSRCRSGSLWTRQKFLTLAGMGSIGTVITAFTAYQISETMQYSKLNALLRDGRWKEADRETLTVMLSIARLEKQGNFQNYSLNSFPCSALSRIDSLWSQHSAGRFGFEAQQKIYVDCGGDIKGNRLDSESVISLFSERVGWKVGKTWLEYDGLTFDPSAPDGHLPALMRGGALVFGGCEEVALVGGFFMYGCFRRASQNCDRIHFSDT